jgi:hypothetical protein
MRIFNETTLVRAIFTGMNSFALMMAVGCKTESVGTERSAPYYLHDNDSEFVPTGPKFKLSKDAAEMPAYNGANKLQQTSTVTTNKSKSK